MPNLLPIETIEKKILVLRGKKVMLDRDLAGLYQVEAKALNQAVKRNKARFPEEFMFQLSQEETRSLRSQFVTLKRGAHFKYRPYAFTEHGVAMLSSVLNSEKAVQVNILIIKAFMRMREMLATHIELRHAVENLERRVDKHDRQIQTAIEAIRQLLEPIPSKQPGHKMGFIKG